MLPLNGNTASAVVTISTDRSDALVAMPSAEFSDWIRARFGSRLGHVTLIGERHLYPLVAVYARRFAGPRFALIGDAAATARLDIGAMGVLGRYAAEHRRATLPIYLGTNALVGLFTDDRMPARMPRRAVFRIARRLPPLKWGVTRQLTGTRN
jgi:2-polyprenyl-6-methoxyphenol hydroxylase-like FAD-dependent oxidoreductase